MKNIIRGLIFGILFLIGSYNVYATSDFTYTIDAAGDATITSYTGSATNLTIPSTIDGHNVKKIGKHAFDETRNSTHCKGIKTITISSGITTIEDFAFIGCDTITTINLPNTITSLGTQTFIGCSKLSKINIPSNLKRLEDLIFQETAFTEFTIPEHVEYVGDGVFRIVKSLKTVKVYSKTVTYRGNPFEYHADNLVIYGYKGSTTETFAKTNNITFKDIENVSTNISVTSVSLNRNIADLGVGEKLQLTATVSPSNATNKKVTWSSSNPNIATVNNGVVTANNIGQTTITAVTEDGRKIASCKVTVSKKEIAVTSLKLDKSKLTMNIGSTYRLTATITPSNATNKNLIWTSSDQRIVKVDNDGNLTAITDGNVTITVATEDNLKKASCIVTVSKKEIAITNITFEKQSETISLGKPFVANIKVEPSNTTDNNLIWTSSDESIASVKDGIVTPISEGIVTITVTNNDKTKTSSMTLKILKEQNIPVEKIELNTTSVVLVAGTSKNLVATIIPDNATNKKLVWKSDNTKIATVTNGKINALNAGTTTIIVTNEDGTVSSFCNVTVYPKGSTALTSIELDKHELEVLSRTSEILTPTVTPAKTPLEEIVWYSSNRFVATVAEGVVTGVTPGTAIVYASNKEGTIIDSCKVTVKVNPNIKKSDKNEILMYMGGLIVIVMGTIALSDVLFKKKKKKAN